MTEGKLVVRMLERNIGFECSAADENGEAATNILAVVASAVAVATGTLVSSRAPEGTQP